MGGEIWVESERNRGTCFHITFPKNIDERYVEMNEVNSQVIDLQKELANKN